MKLKFSIFFLRPISTVWHIIWLYNPTILGVDFPSVRSHRLFKDKKVFHFLGNQVPLQETRFPIRVTGDDSFFYIWGIEVKNKKKNLPAWWLVSLASLAICHWVNIRREKKTKISLHCCPFKGLRSINITLKAFLRQKYLPFFSRRDRTKLVNKDPTCQ